MVRLQEILNIVLTAVKNVFRDKLKTYPTPSKTREGSLEAPVAAAAKATRQVIDSLFKRKQASRCQSPVTLEVTSSFTSPNPAHPVSQSLSSANKFGSEEMSIQVKEG